MTRRVSHHQTITPRYGHIMTNSTVQTTWRPDRATYERLRHYAVTQHRTVTSVLIELVNEGLDHRQAEVPEQRS